MNQDELSRSYTESINSAWFDEANQDRSIDNFSRAGSRRPSYTNLSTHSNYTPYESLLRHPSNISDIHGLPDNVLSRTTTSTSCPPPSQQQDSYDVEPTPLPKVQIFIICIILFSEPLTSTILFPFIYFMIRDFHLSDDEKEIGAYAGWITSVFFLAQFCTALIWGRLSDRHGRRPVLLTGLIGNSLSSCSFGLSKSLWWAVASRAMCGVLNGNGGVARSMLSEITDETNRAFAFSLFGFCWGIGMIGPALGGFLCNPVDNFPSLFGGNAFLKEYPYFLPCFVSSIGSLVGFGLGFFYLKESNPAVLRRKQIHSHALTQDEREALLDTTDSKFTKQQQPAGLSSITKTSYLCILTYSIFAFHSMVFDEVMPLFFSTPAYAGGLGFGTQELARALSFAGFLQLIFQFYCYPWVNKRLPSLQMVRTAFLIFIPCYFVYPELTTVKHWFDTAGFGLWPFRGVYMSILSFRNLGNCFAFTSIMVLVNNSATEHNLGMVNGALQTCLSLVRALAPTVGGTIWSISLREGNAFPFDRHLIYYAIGILTILNLAQSYNIPQHLSLGGRKKVQTSRC